MGDVHGIPGQLAILDGIIHRQIQGMAVAMHVKCPGLHTEDLRYNTILMPSHIGSTVVTLPSALVPLQVHSN